MKKSANRIRRPARKAQRKLVTNNAAAAIVNTKNLPACSDSIVQVNGAAVVKKKFEGREHLVAPVVAVKEGVLNGMLVLFDEFSAYPSAWEGVPLPIYHPEKNRQRVTANTPDILEGQVVGRMFNVRADELDKSLKAELWIDIVKAQASNDGKEIIRRLEAGESLEVSTGYFADLEIKTGFHGGKAYEAIQRNMRPDHVALLPEKKGACSWTDGCGAPRLNHQQLPAVANDVQYLVVEKGGTGHLPVTGPDGKPDHRLMGAAWAALHAGYRGNKYEGPGKQKAIAKLKSIYKKEKMDLPAANAFDDPATRFHFQTNQDDYSHDDIAMMIREELMEEDGTCYYYLADVYDTYFIYTAESKMYVPPPASPAGMFKRDYSISDQGIQLGAAQAVVRKTQYVEVTDNQETTMKKEELVQKLIASGAFKEENRALLMAANAQDLERLLPVDPAVQAAANRKKETVDAIIAHAATPWKEEHRGTLMTFDQAYLDGLKPATPAPAPQANAQQLPEFKTEEDFLKIVPAGLRSIFKAGMTENQQRKAQLVTILSGNQACRFTKEELEGMELDFLEKVADTMQVSYVGRALPRTNEGRARVNNDDNGVPEPPKVPPLIITK